MGKGICRSPPPSQNFKANKKVLLRKRKRHTDRHVASPGGGEDRQNRRRTDTCENITCPHPSDAVGKNQNLKRATNYQGNKLPCILIWMLSHSYCFGDVLLRVYHLQGDSSPPTYYYLATILFQWYMAWGTRYTRLWNIDKYESLSENCCGKLESLHDSVPPVSWGQ